MPFLIIAGETIPVDVGGPAGQALDPLEGGDLEWTFEVEEIEAVGGVDDPGAPVEQSRRAADESGFGAVGVDDVVAAAPHDPDEF